MYIAIAVAIVLSVGIYFLFSRRLEGIQHQLRKLEAELNVLKHEEAHKKMQKIKSHTNSPTVADEKNQVWVDFIIWSRERYEKKRWK